MQPQLQPGRTGTASPLSGLLTIFYSPGDAFAASGKRGWVVALVAACLMSLVMNTVVINRVGIGTIVRNQIESNTRVAEQLGPDGIAKAVERAETSTVQKVLTYGGAPIAIAIILAVMAGIYLGLLLVAGGTTNFSAVLTSGAWTMYAVLTVTCIGSIVAVYSMNDFTGVDMQRLFSLNAGMFADEGSPVVRALLSGIDLVAFWAIALNAIGFVTLSERVTKGQALGVLIVMHVVFTGLRAGWAALFG